MINAGAEDWLMQDWRDAGLEGLVFSRVRIS